MKKLIAIVLTIALLLPCLSFLPAIPVFAAVGDVTTGTLKSSSLLDDLMDQYTSFIVVKHKQLGGSHYAYTEAVSDTYDSGAPNGEETTMFRPGSQMVLVELEKNGDSVTRTETVLLESETGVIRDPDVSVDGTKVLFSWKKEEKTDDFHLYEYDLITKKTRQLTFGLGVADTEPKYLPDGNIVFSSCRTIQTVDCFKVPVSNLYLCGPNGENIVRVGYDQVHTTYPTVTEDGRVLYTRWDYNDRNQLFVQGVFQMFPDGTGQTEVWGNNANFPTTLLHTRPVKGVSDKYLSIASGHHVRQAGKLVVLDTSVGRNDPDAVTLVFPDGYYGKDESVDHYGEKGPLYKYPYSISEDQFLVSYAPDGWISMSNATPSADFSIYLMDMDGNKVNLVPGTPEYPASQIVPVTTRTLFERASMVNFSGNTGTFYVGNVYEGEGMEGVKFGTAKYLRVVALDYRAFAIGHSDTFGIDSMRYATGDPLSAISTGNGSWDVKRVLGMVPIEADGSALFKVPSETPVYFQVLDAEGQVIQSMRSWSTLMPGETFSCVGCHEDKNTVPPAVSTTTIAMAKGVQELQPEPWQTGEGYEDYDPYEDSRGFSYLEEIQPILDESCVKCHNNQAEAFDMTDAYTMVGADTTLEEDEEAAAGETVDVIKNGETWEYFKSSTLTDVADGWNTPSFTEEWSTAQAPFGDRETTGTKWNDTTYIWIRYEFDIANAASFKGATAILNTFYDDYPEFYLNGNLIFDPDKWVDAYTTIKVKDAGNYLVNGKNVLAIRCQNTSGGRTIDTSLSFEKEAQKDTVEIFGIQEDWKYTVGSNKGVAPKNWMAEDFNDASWMTGKAGFGNTGGANTNWKGADTSIYMRKEFELTAAQISAIADMKLVLDIYYDQNPQVYINGVKVFSNIGWNNGYKEYSLAHDAVKLLKEGKNVIAMTCVDVNIYGYNTTYLDAGLFATEKASVPFSLEGRMMNSAGIVKEFPLSYLVLTASTSLINTREWVGSPENNYTNWISSMSQCEILDPYQYGSAKSNLVQILKENHQGVNLSDAKLRKIMAWIDLAVPAFGDYFEGNTWNNNQIRWADEYTAKRDYYVTMNEMARKARAQGNDAVKKDITISYKSGDTVYDDVYEFSGAKKLEIPTYYKSGDVLTVTLPEGEQYLGLTMDNLMGEAILYVPGGTYTFTVPEANNTYNRTFINTNDKTITARVVGADELGENYNLARNPYDLTDLTGNMQVTAYPHATTSSNYGNLPAYFVRNAIDGVTANLLHGSYPSQSWGPDQGTGHWMKVDFGREVNVSQVVLTLRAHAGHDTYYKSGTLEFSDGSRISIDIKNTADKQAFSFDTVKTSYVLLTDLVPVDISGEDWAAVTEFEVYGTSEKEAERVFTTDVYVSATSGNDSTGNGTKDAPYKTVAKAIDSKKSESFGKDDALRILLSGEATDSSTLLFGEETLFHAEGGRLPIIIEGQNGASLTLSALRVASANSYTFKNLTLNTAEISEFFAGSGEVVFENVTFGNTTTSFYGDDFSSSDAFAAWESVAEGTVTSITFGKGTTYSGPVAAVGGETTENSPKIVAKAAVDGGTLSTLQARAAEGVSIKESEVVVKNGANVTSLIGIDGGAHTGDLAITVGADKKDESVVKELVSAKGEYSLSGMAKLTVLGGNLGEANGKSATYTTSGAAGALGTVNTISGGTFKGGFIGVYTTGSMTSVGRVVNDVTGGDFRLSFVGGSAGYNKDVVIPKVINNIGENTKIMIDGGILTDESGASETTTFAFIGGSIGKGAVKIRDVVNNISGSAQIISGFGGARVFTGMNAGSAYIVENIVNNICGGDIQSYYSGSRTGGAVKSISNKLSNTNLITFYGGTNGTSVNSGSTGSLAIDTTLERGTTVTNYYGGTLSGTVTGKINTLVNGGNVTNLFAGTRTGKADGDVSATVNGGHITTYYGGNAEGGSIQGKVITTVNGGTIDTFYGSGKSGTVVGDTETNILGGTFTRKFVTGSAGAAAGNIITTVPSESCAVFEKEFAGTSTAGSALTDTATIAGGIFKGTVSGSGITLTGSPVIYGTVTCGNAVGGSGALLIGKNAFVSVDKVSGNLFVKQIENFETDHKYFFAGDISEANISIIEDENRSIGSYKELFENGYSVIGFRMAPVGAKLILDKKVGVKLYFNEVDISDIKDRFTYSVKLGGTKVATGTYSDLVSENGYYAMKFTGIGLSDFDTEFEVIATGLCDDNSAKYNSIVKLAELGAESYEKQNEKALFRSIADLGRVVHDPSSAKYALGYKDVIPAPRGEKAEEGALVTITGKNLLMNDAIGIRLYGTAESAEDVEDIKVLVDEMDVTAICDISEPNLTDGKYKFSVDIFFSVSKMQTEQNIAIYDKNGKLCLKLTDQVDWIAQMIINKEPENNLAKQVLTYIQKVYNYMNDIQHIITPPSSGNEGVIGDQVDL